VSHKQRDDPANSEYHMELAKLGMKDLKDADVPSSNSSNEEAVEDTKGGHVDVVNVVNVENVSKGFEDLTREDVKVPPKSGGSSNSSTDTDYKSDKDPDYHPNEDVGLDHGQGREVIEVSSSSSSSRFPA
jgi:hypothetical protein